MDAGALAVRFTVGPLFIGHGAQKLFGWFEGHGLEGTGGFMESLGLRPGRRSAMAAGTAEVAGGALLTAGALTPLASTLLSSTMITAMRTAHRGKGPWVTGGGWEYNAVLVTVLTALVESGPGPFSVDRRRFPELRGRLWAAASLGAAIAGSHLATHPRLQEQAGAAPSDDTVGHAEEGRFARPESASPAETAPNAVGTA